MKGNYIRCSNCGEQIPNTMPKIRIIETVGGLTNSHNYSGRSTGINYCKPCWVLTKGLLERWHSIVSGTGSEHRDSSSKMRG